MPKIALTKLFQLLIVFVTTQFLFAASHSKADETPKSQTQSAKPNVLIFFIDDLGYHDLGCYGSKFYETPAIDQLASRSVKFTNFYSAHPVCSPTRASMMSGKAPQRVGITQWIPQPNETHLPLSEVTLAEAFSEAGYQTGYIGKWHLGEKDDQMPDNQGFQWMKGVNRGGQPASYYHPFAGRKRKGVSYWDVPDMEDAKGDDYLTDKLTDHAISFVEQNRQKPFLLCFAHYAVHTPIQPPKNLVGKYDRKVAKLFGNKKLAPITERNNAVTNSRQDNAKYGAMVENLDSNVKRVLDKLQELKLMDNTIVVFTSDNGGLSTLKRGNGGPTCNLPLRAGKGWNYEGGTKIPTLISWPNGLKPNVVSTPGITMDFYPTLLELAGLKQRPKQHLDGQSLVSAMKSTPSAKLKKRFLAWHYPHNHGSGHTPSDAIREGDWKLIHLSDKNEYELYNLKSDPSESKNLAGENPELVKELSQKLAKWVEETSINKQ